jgi:viroplasmin and RNaseH domain-containing protein
MKSFVIIQVYDFGHEGYERNILGVFNSYEKALRYCGKSTKEWDDITIQEWDGSDMITEINVYPREYGKIKIRDLIHNDPKTT